MTVENPARGSVVEFDGHIGLGRIRTDSGETLLFHCAEIGDGSRQIGVGQQVSFVARKKFNILEAFEIHLT